MWPQDHPQHCLQHNMDGTASGSSQQELAETYSSYGNKPLFPEFASIEGEVAARAKEMERLHPGIPPPNHNDRAEGIRRAIESERAKGQAIELERAKGQDVSTQTLPITTNHQCIPDQNHKAPPALEPSSILADSSNTFKCECCEEEAEFQMRCGSSLCGKRVCKACSPEFSKDDGIMGECLACYKVRKSA